MQEKTSDRFVSEKAMLSALAAYESGMTVKDACEKFHVKRGTLYWWRARRNTPKRPPGEAPKEVMSAIAAYQGGEKVQAACARFGVDPRKVYYWINRLNIPKRGRRGDWKKDEPDPHVKAAVIAYKRGDTEVGDIVKKFGVSWSVLYHWIDRLKIPRRRFFREAKVGRPLEKPFQTECDWCGDPLTENQIKRRRKYCCPECQRDGVADAIIRNLRSCPAPGCGAKILDDSPFCSWDCFKAVMKERFA